MDLPLPLYTRALLQMWGFGSAELTASVEIGLLERLRPGIYTLGETWMSATPEERVVTRAQALLAISRTSPLFSHETAAAIQGLPLFAADPRLLHTIVDAGRPGSTSGVIRHRGEVSPDEVCTVDGLRCTTLVRTISDMARTATFEQSVTATDAALRSMCTPARGVYDSEGASEFCRQALRSAKRSAHGISRAERVLRFADGRAQLPGESVSRVRLAELGFRRPRLQVAVPAPRGQADYIVDFGLDDVGAFGEFDGRIKYEDGRILVERSADEVFDREKQREDWIRGTTGRRVVRWGWPHIRTAATLADRLAAFGIRPLA